MLTTAQKVVLADLTHDGAVTWTAAADALGDAMLATPTILKRDIWIETVARALDAFETRAKQNVQQRASIDFLP